MDAEMPDAMTLERIAESMLKCCGCAHCQKVIGRWSNCEAARSYDPQEETGTFRCPHCLMDKPHQHAMDRKGKGLIYLTTPKGANVRCHCKKFSAERAERLGHRCDELGTIPKHLGKIPTYNPDGNFQALEKPSENIGRLSTRKVGK